MYLQFRECLWTENPWLFDCEVGRCGYLLASYLKFVVQPNLSFFQKRLQKGCTRNEAQDVVFDCVLDILRTFETEKRYL